MAGEVKQREGRERKEGSVIKGSRHTMYQQVFTDSSSQAVTHSNALGGPKMGLLITSSMPYG
jgi:hypothetical protein